ncbi:conserved Plasmodium protein, unknown function [Plasmodium berghei ANKA]|uniref:Uncharacterized protein n=1 Tax=Plasmodium berghei (strain Anka) TaxID=5823 RepID=A0A509AV04_PLABA|nr:conserved Plasmodium protein, unknown function [Plasmodium berghei ANKA]VUC58341.1 conserved Plasmodium protein, unknown function [Plasmodium berghei ANKA]|eukprot:XP_034424104.1 conserved Plasmodium protein, unknown function [Plasmodium berghei ANKA]
MAILYHTFSTIWKDIKSLYKPYTAFSFLFFPCAINVYGIYKFMDSNLPSNDNVCAVNE